MECKCCSNIKPVQVAKPVKPVKPVGSLSTVVNVKVAHIRPQYDNLEEWMKDPQNIYIGRKGIVFIAQDDGSKKRFPPNNSYWANPFKVDKNSTREDIVLKYKNYITEKLDHDGWDKLNELRGKKLGCWCKPDICHGDILLNLLDK